MELSVAFYLIAAAAVLLTGLSKSGFGGGLGVMAVPVMSLHVSPQFAAAVMMPILLAMDLLIVWQYRFRWNRTVIAMLIPGAAVGLLVGGMTFHWMSADLIRLAIGLLAMLFVAQFIWGHRRGAPARAAHRSAAFLLGTVSGFASFVAHAGGPPVKGLLLRQDMDKSMFVGTNTMFFFAMNAVKTGAYAVMGQFSADSIRTSIALAPLVFVGIGLGLILHRFVPQAVFTRLVYGFLFLAGAKLLFDATGALLHDMGPFGA